MREAALGNSISLSPPPWHRPYVRLIHISSYFTIPVLSPKQLFPPPRMLFHRSPPSASPPPLSLPPLLFFSSYLWKRHFKSLPVWISLVSCVFLPVNNPESRLSLFPSLSICQSAPPLNWKPLRPTSTHSIRAPRLLLRLPLSAKIPFFFSFVPTARALENANTDPPQNLNSDFFSITEIKGLKLRVFCPPNGKICARGKMPQLNGGGGDDLGANDEMISFKDEGEQEEKISENSSAERDLADVKSSLVNESETNQNSSSDSEVSWRLKIDFPSGRSHRRR